MSPPTTKKTSRRTVEIVVVTALITLTLTVVGLVETVDKWIGLIRPTLVKIADTDVRPNPRSSNARLLVANGSFENIGDGELLWLAISPPNDSKIYPNAQSCDTKADSKTWSCSILFGNKYTGYQPQKGRQLCRLPA